MSRRNPDPVERLLTAVLIACVLAGFALVLSWIGDLVQRLW